MVYEYIIVGGGIAGCTIGYFLKKSGANVLIIDKNSKLFDGASGAAGAFLSPLPGKKNSYNTLVNSAIDYSLDFYKKLLDEGFYQNGVLRIPFRINDKEKFDSIELDELKSNYLSANDLKQYSQFFKEIDGYFYEKAAIVEPFEVCKKLTKDMNIMLNKEIKNIEYKNDQWYVDDLVCENIILTTGANRSLILHPYFMIEPVCGLKIDIYTSTKVPFTIHKNISLSTTKKDGVVSIGASNDKGVCTKEIREKAIEKLIFQANEFLELKDLKFLNYYFGARATIRSYFPIIGEVVNSCESLKKYPSLMDGTKIPKTFLTTYPKLYIINALGSRGFVFAPYLSDLLCKKILNKDEIINELSTYKLFYKWARKNSNTLKQK